MKVKQLKMTSFRGIGNLTLQFTENEPTVFIGENGVGKSSILDCLAILLSLFTDKIRLPTIDDRIISKIQGDSKNGQTQTRNEIIVLLNDSQEVKWS